ADTLDQLLDARPELPEQLGDRAADTWEPLLAIADHAGHGWPDRARTAAVTLSASENDGDDSLGVRLLGDIRLVFAATAQTRITSEQLIETCAQIEDAPWGDWYGRTITPRRIAQLLKPFGIKPKTIRFGDRIANGYERANFDEPWKRYLAHDDQRELVLTEKAEAY